MKMAPFKAKTQQELLTLYFERRGFSANGFCSNQARRFVQDIVFGDEAAFHMNGRINSQNNKYYALAGSHPEEEYFDVPSNRKKFQYEQDCLEMGQ